MKIDITRLFLMILIFLFGCVSGKKLDLNSIKAVNNKAFVSESDVRTIDFVFDSSECRLSFFYKCNNFEEKHRRITIICDYKQLNDSILIIKNRLYENDQYKMNLTPPQEALVKCTSSKQASKKNKNKVNPWGNDDGFIPIIDIDTINIIVKNRKQFLYLSKKREQDIYNFLWKEKR